MIAVFLFHLLELGKLPLPPGFRIGWIGVDLFYVLSGFFIGSAVLRPSQWRPGAFAKKRLLRIVPGYYVSMLLVLAFTVPVYLVTWNGFKHVLSHLLFLHNLSLETHGSINGAYWTLGVEASFYFLMIIIAPLLRRSRSHFVLTIGLGFIITYCWRIAVYEWGPEDAFQRFFVATQLPGTLDQFAIGVVVAYLLLKTDLIAAIAGPRRLVLLIAAILTCLYAFEYMISHAGDYWQTFAAITFWRTWVAAGFALCIMLLLATPGAWLDVLLRNSGLSYIGKISYSVYLFHIPIILSVTSECREAGLASSASGLLTAATTLLVASVSYHLVESRWHVRGTLSPTRSGNRGPDR